jgi:ankyrin repeat protein
MDLGHDNPSLNSEEESSIRKCIRESNVKELSLILNPGPEDAKEMLMSELIFISSPSFLHEACKCGNLESVKIVATASKRVENQYGNIFATKRGKSNETALHIACLYGHDHIVRYLIQEYPLACIERCNRGLLPIHCACLVKDKPEIVYALVDFAKCTAFSTCQPDKKLPHHYAALYGNTRILKLLCEVHPEGLLVTDVLGNSVAQLACFEATELAHPYDSHITLTGEDKPKDMGKLVQVIKEADPTMAALHLTNPENGRSVLHISSLSSEYGLAIAEMLLQEATVPIEPIYDAERYTPLHFAAQCGSIPLVHFLLKKGYPYGVHSRNGRSALHFAMQQGHFDITLHLLSLTRNGMESPLTLASQDTGSTPIHLAALKTDAAFIGMLARLHPSEFVNAISMKDLWGSLPLHLALTADASVFSEEKIRIIAVAFPEAMARQNNEGLYPVQIHIQQQMRWFIPPPGLTDSSLNTFVGSFDQMNEDSFITSDTGLDRKRKWKWENYNVTRYLLRGLLKYSNELDLNIDEAEMCAMQTCLRDMNWSYRMAALLASMKGNSENSKFNILKALFNGYNDIWRRTLCFL